MKKTFTITIFTENNIGLLVRMTTMFLRRRIHIESLNVAASEVEGIHRFTIVINETEEVTKKLVLQIDKQVDVFKTFFHADEEIVWQEQVLYKVNSTNEEIGSVLKTSGARCISAHQDYTVLETTGSPEITNAITAALKPFGITELVKSGRIAIMNSNYGIHQKLKQIEPVNKCVAGVENNV